ncbi:MAG: hypothetical protein ACREUW_08750 [Burkholderiales bacterium]
MEHAEFVVAYQRGEVRVVVDPKLAARFMSARLLLPFVALPVIGGGIALALTGWIWSGLAVIAAGIIGPRLIKRSAPHFVLTQALADASFYADATRAGVLRAD